MYQNSASGDMPCASGAAVGCSNGTGGAVGATLSAAEGDGDGASVADAAATTSAKQSSALQDSMIICKF